MTGGLKARLVLTVVLIVAAAVAATYTLSAKRLAGRPTGGVAAVSPAQAVPPPTSRTNSSENDKEMIVRGNKRLATNSTIGTNATDPTLPVLNSNRLGIDRSVVGQPFQLSPSVIQSCKSDGVECRLMMKSVAEMVQQPRDIDWATRMEAKLQASVDVEGPDKYVIRNLECRTSTCLLEVEVRVPGAFPRYQDAITAALMPNVMVQGEPEQDSSGGRLIVELMDFKRR
jgi:hypothetical protein